MKGTDSGSICGRNVTFILLVALHMRSSSRMIASPVLWRRSERYFDRRDSWLWCVVCVGARERFKNNMKHANTIIYTRNEVDLAMITTATRLHKRNIRMQLLELHNYRLEDWQQVPLGAVEYLNSNLCCFLIMMSKKCGVKLLGVCWCDLVLWRVWLFFKISLPVLVITDFLIK